MKNQDFGQKLIATRKAKGLTQKDVAQMCKITVRTIQRLESGRVSPRAYTIKAISEKLGIDYFNPENGHERIMSTNQKKKKPALVGFKDLFDLKTHTVKKIIAILSVPMLLAIVALIFYPHSEVRAQTYSEGYFMNSFAFELYHNTQSADENLLISPTSAYNLLLMACEGARNKTKKELKNILFLNSAEVNDDNYLNNFTATADSASVLQVSNAIWYDKEIVLEGNYSKVVSDNYLSELNQIDFTNRTLATSTINKWASEQTRGKIDQIVDVENLNSNTKLIFSNIVNFKGKWLIDFNKEKTKAAPFFENAVNQVEVDFMHSMESLKYLETDEYQFVSKPYEHSNLSFGVLLPKKIFGLKAIEQKFNQELYNAILDSATYVKTSLSLPKLKLASNVFLAEALKKAGLESAFTGKADFSGITKDASVHLSEVLHRTTIEMFEDRTEAAATTSTTYITGKPSYKILKADHPFIFFIFNSQSRALHFMGRYTKPQNGKRIDKENMVSNLEKRKNEKFSFGWRSSDENPLIIVDGKVTHIGQVNFDSIKALKVIEEEDLKNHIGLSIYPQDKSNGVIMITTKRKDSTK